VAIPFIQGTIDYFGQQAATSAFALLMQAPGVAAASHEPAQPDVFMTSAVVRVQ
jgi:hypothetical protein